MIYLDIPVLETSLMTTHCPNGLGNICFTFTNVSLPMTNPAITVEGVWKTFRLYRERNQYLKATITRGRRSKFEEFEALQDVSFDVPQGQTFGIIGSNGSGKSTLLKCLAGILTPDRGELSAGGRTAALLELGAGFHPELSGRENVALNGAILGMTRREIEKRFDEIVEFAGLERFIDTPVKNYSSGMVVRLGFAVAINVEPEILIIDEVLAVGDEEFQARCFRKIEQFRREGRTIVFVSHGLSQVSQLCDDALWLDKGRVRSIGPAYEIVSEYTGESHQAPAPDSNHERVADSDRWGTGEARIDSVRILDSSGRPTSTLRSGEPVRFVVDYSINEAISDLVVGLRITHLHGLTVWGSNTKRCGFPLAAEGNGGSVEFVIPSMNLLEGTFDLTVAISDKTEVNAYDHYDRCHRFNVVQHGTFDEGTTRIRGEWSRRR